MESERQRARGSWIELELDHWAGFAVRAVRSIGHGPMVLWHWFWKGSG